MGKRVGLATAWSRVRIPLRQLNSLRNFGNSVYPALPVSFGGDTKGRRSLLSGVYARGSKRSHQSALEMCNLWTPHSSLEKDNSLNHSCVSPTDGLFGVYISKKSLFPAKVPAIYLCDYLHIS